jgi:sigma-B regulation protein RsbU (phosphoserine phosphatase)
MLLRSRLTVLASVVLALLIAGFAGTLLYRDAYFASRYNLEVSQSHRFAWEKLAGHYRDELTSAMHRFTADAQLAAAVRRGDTHRIAAYIDSLRRDMPHVRVDLVSVQRTLVYSSSMGAEEGRGLLDAGALQQLLASGKPMAGLVQTGGQRFEWLRAEVVPGTNKVAPFVVILATDVLPALDDLKRHLDAQVYLANLKGRMAHGTDAALFAQARFVSASRNETVSSLAVGDKTYLVTNLPQLNPEGRLIGMLVSLRDVTWLARQDRASNVALLLGVGAAVAVFLALMFFYLRSSFRPLSQTVTVLNALAKGDTHTQLADDIDDTGQDETAHIARGVAALREEMLTLNMLRDERRRARTQQERVIREELRNLAANLDTDARDEVLKALSGLSDAAPTAGETDGAARNELAVLAGTLSRMTGMISAQHARLLQLLREISAAAESKARLAGLQQELEIARKMQLAILPRAAPQRSELTLASAMIPAKEIGGDFYDYFMLDDTHLGVVVADVSGKGVAAAFFMAISRTLLKSTAQFLHDPQACITQLNDLLCVDNDQMMFVSAFYGVLNLKTGELVFVNAGHNPPVLLRANRSDPVYLPRSPSVVLAVMDAFDFPSQSLRLAQGDTLVLYTDGITEATNAQGELFGDARLLSTLSRVDGQADVASTIDGLLTDVRAFEKGAPQADDITCVALHYRGVAQVLPSLKALV